MSMLLREKHTSVKKAPNLGKGVLVKITCPQCGFSREIPEDRLPAGAVVARCPRCACRFRFSRQDGVGEIVPPINSQPEEEDIRVVASNAYQREARRFENEEKAKATVRQQIHVRNPWDEAPGQDGWIAAFYQTVIHVMFQTPQFFKSLTPQAQIWKPLAFFIIVCLIQTLVERAWGDAFYSFLATDAERDPQLNNLLKLIAPSSNLALALLLRTGSLLLQLFAFAALMYFAYRIIAPAKTRFTLIYQVLIYSSAPWLLCVIPGVGSLAGTIWGLVCLAVGCKTALNLNWVQTSVGFLPLFALLAPFLLQFARLLGQGT